MPVFEALACGTPILVTKFGPMWDWSKEVAFPIEVKCFTRTFQTNYKEAHVSTNDLYHKMWTLYKTNPKEKDLDKYVKFASRFDWIKVALKWASLFERIETGSNLEQDKPLSLTIE